LLKKNYDLAKAENLILKRENDQFKKGNSGSEQQIKALNEMHS